MPILYEETLWKSAVCICGGIHGHICVGLCSHTVQVPVHLCVKTRGWNCVVFLQPVYTWVFWDKVSYGTHRLATLADQGGNSECLCLISSSGVTKAYHAHLLNGLWRSKLRLPCSTARALLKEDHVKPVIDSLYVTSLKSKQLRFLIHTDIYSHNYPNIISKYLII